MQDVEAPLTNRLGELLDQLTDLPTHSGAALGILSVIDDPRSSAADLARLVDTDPALSTKILRLANSATYGLSRQVGSAQVAVTVVGFETVRSFAVLAASGAFAGEGGDPPTGFWGHSVATASGAAVVARRRGWAAPEAFSAGLLHDLGAMLLYRIDPEMAEALNEELADDLPSRLAREREVYGMHHGEVGAAVLDAWGFPSSMIHVQRDHHRLPVMETPDLVRAVRAGEALADLGGAPALVELAPDAVEALNAAGIERDEADELAARAAEGAEGLAALLAG